MSRKFLLWAMALVVIIPTLFGGVYWLYWDKVQRFAPVTITNADDLPKIQALLDQADYVSPGPGQRWMYLISYRDCATCRVYEQNEFPKLQAAGVETRVVPFALPDNQGVKRSTPEERSTIAELWLNRSWPLYEQWQAATDDEWKPDALKPVPLKTADTDMARTAVVGASRDFINQLAPLLRKNKVTVAYPLLIWRDKNNQLRVCSCTNEQSFGYILADFGAHNVIETGGKTLFGLKLPPLPKFGSEESASASSSPATASEPQPGTPDYGPDSGTNPAPR